MATVLYNEIQKKLDRLAKLEAGNRARSKKYLDKIKALGKRQISVILDESTIDELSRRRDESIKAGTPLTFGDLISLSINSSVNQSVNIAGKVTAKSVNPISMNTIESGNIDGKSDGILIKKDVNTVSQGDVKSDVKDFTHGNAGTNRELYKIHLDKILREIPPGQWKKEAEKLNKRGIKTAKGLPWTNNNLRMACSKFKK